MSICGAVPYGKCRISLATTVVGRSHPVSVEVREFDWDQSRKGASQLPRTTTIRLGTPKTTTGENLIFALTYEFWTIVKFATRYNNMSYSREVLLYVKRREIT